MKKKILAISGLVIIAAAVGVYFNVTSQKDDASNKQSTQQKQTNNTKAEPQFDKTLHSITEASSVWVVVNKQNPLTPQAYLPDDLVLPKVSLRIPEVEQMKMRKEAAEAVEAMFAAAKTSNLHLQITTAFRGYNYQSILYNGYVSEQGKATADTQSARPGFSEHQTGWAVDIRPESGECYLEACFGTMEEGKWLAENAHTYGFILRYPENKTDITGYTYEPWHFRYVGKDLATEMYNKKILTLEEFFNLPAAPDYKS